jgi:Uma2 family endonuclease
MHQATIQQRNPIFFPREQPFSSTEIKTRPKYTEAEFYQFSAANPDLRIELDKNGTLIIMPPVDFDGGFLEGNAYGSLYMWWFQHQKGKTFSPSTAFTLPDGEIRAADGAWISDENLQNLPMEERKRFARIVPDFVIEVRSTSDNIGKLKRKISDIWIKNGVKLAFLIDPKSEKAWVYRADGSIDEVVGFNTALSGENVCEGLKFDLNQMRLF